MLHFRFSFHTEWPDLFEIAQLPASRPARTASTRILRIVARSYNLSRAAGHAVLDGIADLGQTARGVVEIARDHRVCRLSSPIGHVLDGDRVGVMDGVGRIRARLFVGNTLKPVQSVAHAADKV